MLKTTATLALTIAALALTTATATPAMSTASDRTASPVAHTDKGALRGTLTGTARVFQGVPYAAPPTAGRRWTAPAPAPGWRGVRHATRPGAACAQSGAIGIKGPKSNEENCLFLNVTSPRTVSAAPRPVMVWLHGGDHEDGEGAMYGAERLAAQGDVVVVTVNYRLGALGWLGDGNYGLQDQQAALRWVRANAAAFGGDPRNLTLFGESGGARSVCANLVSPASAGLFDRAILQSGPCLDDHENLTRAEALRNAGKLDSKFEKDLRGVGAEQLVAADDEETRYGPVYGTKLLPRAPREAFASGRFNRVPVLHGINRDEETFRIWGAEFAKRSEDPAATLTDADVRTYLAQPFGAGAVDRILARYPASAYGASHGRALAAAMTDALWGRTAVDTNRALGARTQTYAYEFAEAENPWFKDLPRGSFPVGAPHLAELPYLFDLGWAEPLNTAQQALSASLIDTWSDFARTGRAAWKPYTPAAPNVRSLSSTGPRPTDFEGGHKYPFWKELLG
ncbi:carboxylesterase/lipase family protein [Streptomyces sp. NPDC002187]|uniref:carboxylesterase/lipase family protein n=1 Tax=Streptomyces sp. NPDC002187 TaxID=3364637 RepID=UPI0036884E8A